MQEQIAADPLLVPTFVRMLWPVGNYTADAEMEKRFDEFVRDLRIVGLLTA